MVVASTAYLLRKQKGPKWKEKANHELGIWLRSGLMGYSWSQTGKEATTQTSHDVCDHSEFKLGGNVVNLIK